MYDQDTFFQLTLLARTGLVLLSLVMAFVLIVLMLLVCKKLPRLNVLFGALSRVSIAILFLWLFVWLSPQIYYLYYLVIIGDLPWQNVISAPPSLGDLAHMLSFQSPNSLSRHAKAALGWVLMFVAAISVFLPDHETPE